MSNSEFKEIKNFLISIDSRLSNVEVRLENIESRLANLEVRLEKVEKRLDMLEYRVSSLEDRVQVLEERSNEDHVSLKSLQDLVLGIHNYIYNELSIFTHNIDNRVSVLEGKLNS